MVDSKCPSCYENGSKHPRNPSYPICCQRTFEDFSKAQLDLPCPTCVNSGSYHSRSAGIFIATIRNSIFTAFYSECDSEYNCNSNYYNYLLVPSRSLTLVKGQTQANTCKKKVEIFSHVGLDTLCSDCLAGGVDCNGVNYHKESGK
jgi:endogenous inhibitor of DNA gyrase (YacG/DUF329 family)